MRHESKYLDLRLCDNMQLMAQYPDKHFELAIVDPEYGIGAAKRTGTTYTAGKNNKGFISKNNIYKAKDWDNAPPEKEYFDELMRVSKNQIIWGGNYFTHILPPTNGWAFWHKKIANATTKGFSAGEMAWTSFKRPLTYFAYDWIGIGGINNGRESGIHPTQKPAALYKWLLDEYAKAGDKILDTHLGSGSIAIACHDYKYHLTACELDSDYFAAMQTRIENHLKQSVLF